MTFRRWPARLALAALLLVGAAAVAVWAPARAALAPGATAPTFTVEAAQGGRTFPFDLAAALKRGPVVLYFYPKSFTGVCTLEAHEFAEAIPQFAALGAGVIGLSGDTIATQREFSAKECRDTFPVGADAGLAVARRYDVALALPGTDVGFAKRVSFVIAPDGTVLSTLADSDAEPHITNALATVRQWRAAHPSP
jgi:thioredoxin-dependent peroxiredoxin